MKHGPLQFVPGTGRVHSPMFILLCPTGANHGSFASGHIGSDLIALAAMPNSVYMHNIEAGNCFAHMFGLRLAQQTSKVLTIEHVLIMVLFTIDTD